MTEPHSIKPLSGGGRSHKSEPSPHGGALHKEVIVARVVLMGGAVLHTYYGAVNRWAAAPA